MYEEIKKIDCGIAREMGIYNLVTSSNMSAPYRHMYKVSHVCIIRLVYLLGVLSFVNRCVNQAPS